MHTFSVNNNNIPQSNSPYLLAEMACAHQGNPEIAKKMVTIASDAKVDGIQLQILDINSLISTKHPAYEKVKHLQIEMDQWEAIIQKAKNENLDVWANIFDLSALEFAISAKVDVLKIHSTDLMNPDMLLKVAESKLPISIGIGGSEIHEISWALDFLKSKGAGDILLMHGYQGFPTPVEDNHLKYINTLKIMFNLPVGLQEHSAGTSELAYTLPLMGVAAGACLIEKHFTYDEGLKDIDHESALSPQRLKEFTNLFREHTLAAGSASVKSLAEKERQYRKNMKKYIVANHSIPKGHRITSADISYKRIGEEGISPNKAGDIIGKMTIQNIDADSPIFMNHLLNEV